MDKDKLYLSALSGGADSTALLLYLLEQGYRVEAVHCNFHLRGEESDRDEEFCKKLCKEHGVELHIAHFDTTAYATLHKESIETAARNLRYNYFFQLVRDLSAGGVCVAHNRNDQAETLLMKLVRGAGIHGLSGMKPVTHIDFNGTDIQVIRPLLKVSRKEIEAFLRERNQPWVTDSTNLEDDATRNKFRLDIIPLLEKINPAAIENIAKAAENLQSAEGVYNAAVGDIINKVANTKGDGNREPQETHIDIRGLQGEPSAEAVLFEILSPMGFNGNQIADIASHIEGTPGREWHSPTHTLVIDRNEIIVVKTEATAKSKELRIPEEGNYIFDNYHKISIKKEQWTASSVIPKKSDTIALDADKVRFPLTLRTFRNGDRFVPFGMKGSKLVSDFLTDNKVSIIEKCRQYVLCDAENRIIWLVNRRPDNRFCIKSDTKCALRISVS